ncbi:farnesyl diphosphate synthase [Paramylibacter kogurei]|uniref:polyprenyl synthetase family protein n=1 Tax=Paramylibacter kogurei TaxID=1889778 RepID=UPI0026A5664A
MSEEFIAKLKETAQQVELELDRILPTPDGNPLGEPMRHAVLNGGKRLRAYLVMESAKMFGVDNKKAVAVASAIECMHAYSLVHDDLPCMDDDDLRRGQPTVHVKWDQATAVLVGDALQTFAFEILGGLNTSAEVRVTLMTTLAKAAGANGMVLGQVQDIAAETARKKLNLEQIAQLQANKTGALIEWSATAGAMIGRQYIGPLVEYAAALGQAFQIVDDILDVEGDASTAGKRLKKDAAAGKATFVSLLGLDGAKSRAAELIETANGALAPYGASADPLRHVAQFVLHRDM